MDNIVLPTIMEMKPKTPTLEDVGIIIAIYNEFNNSINISYDRLNQLCATLETKYKEAGLKWQENLKTIHKFSSESDNSLRNVSELRNDKHLLTVKFVNYCRAYIVYCVSHGNCHNITSHQYILSATATYIEYEAFNAAISILNKRYTINGKQAISITVSNGYIDFSTEAMYKPVTNFDIPLIRSRIHEVISLFNIWSNTSVKPLSATKQLLSNILTDVGLPICWIPKYGFVRACENYILVAAIACTNLNIFEYICVNIPNYTQYNDIACLVLNHSLRINNKVVTRMSISNLKVQFHCD
jgi:hypothetical protein